MQKTLAGPTVSGADVVMTRAEIERRVITEMEKSRREGETVEAAITRFGGMRAVARMLLLPWQD